MLSTDERIAASLQGMEYAISVLWDNLDRLTDTSYLEEIEALLTKCAESVQS